MVPTGYGPVYVGSDLAGKYVLSRHPRGGLRGLGFCALGTLLVLPPPKLGCSPGSRIVVKWLFYLVFEDDLT